MKGIDLGYRGVFVRDFESAMAGQTNQQPGGEAGTPEPPVSTGFTFATQDKRPLRERICCYNDNDKVAEGRKGDWKTVRQSGLVSEGVTSQPTGGWKPYTSDPSKKLSERISKLDPERVTESMKGDRKARLLLTQQAQSNEGKPDNL